MTTSLQHWLSGKPAQGTGHRYGPVYDPATGLETKRVPFASDRDVETAITLARDASQTWSETTLRDRLEVLFAFRELLRTHRDELIEVVTSENGKLTSEAAGEVARGIEAVELACGAPSLLEGGSTENSSRNIDVQSVLQPLGVVGVITPFNFPVMVPLWFIPTAIACGNTVVFKPSERVPSAAVTMAELWSEAGLPPDVLNVVHGNGHAAETILSDPSVDGISFVGSTPVARHVYQRATAGGKRVQALGGAKNHMVVLPDVDPDAAADAAVRAAFGSAGQRCMAISVVVAVGSAGDVIAEGLARRARSLRVGPGHDDVDMGPLVTGEQLRRVRAYIDTGLAEGADLTVDGRSTVRDRQTGGFWLGPTLFDRVTPEMSLYRDEIFGPVLSIVRVDTYAEALDLINSHTLGNGAAIFTGSGAHARDFQHRVQVGMVGLNVPIPVPASYYPFGGWKASFFGDTPVNGFSGVHFYTRKKVVTSTWPPPSDIVTAKREAGGSE